jgi:hypothetical protein
LSSIDIEVEGQLLFEFEKASWSAVKWDEEIAYLHGLQPTGAKAVDILATQNRSAVYMIEVKDPRGHWIEYRDNNPIEKLAEIVANKVRDTISGIVYARDRHPGDHLITHLKSLFRERSAKPVVVLWLEGIELQPAMATSLTSLIERKLHWLKPKVVVTSRKLWAGFAGLRVRSLAGAPWQG